MNIAATWRGLSPGVKILGAAAAGSAVALPIVASSTSGRDEQLRAGHSHPVGTPEHAHGSHGELVALEPAEVVEASPSDHPATNWSGPQNPKARHAPDAAVAWWPQDLTLTRDAGGRAELRFQSTIANLGGAPLPIGPGDRLEYTVSKQDDLGRTGEVVARGAASLQRLDVQPFPPDFGTQVDHHASGFGQALQGVTELAPITAGIVGSSHPSQRLDLGAAEPGSYVLRQAIVRADGSTDPEPYDDVRDTELIVRDDGTLLHASSRYAGPTGD